MSNFNGDRVLIVGGGVIGVASALSLCEQGFKVTIAEQHPELGMGASGRNGAH